jgi:hypothetical protein
VEIVARAVAIVVVGSVEVVMCPALPAAVVGPVEIVERAVIVVGLVEVVMCPALLATVEMVVSLVAAETAEGTERSRSSMHETPRGRLQIAGSCAF